jgi:hypothetical protein
MEADEEAERMSVSTSLDPDVERDLIEPHVERFNLARKEQKTKEMMAAETEIAELLGAELRRRLSLTLSAVEILREDGRPLNPGAIDLANGSIAARGRDLLWLEEQLVEHGEDGGFFPPSPETDRDSRTGAARYHRLSGGAEEVDNALVHFDEDLQADAAASGHAIKGTIAKVEDRAPNGSRKMEPVWTIEAPSTAPTRFRRGSGVCVAGIPKRSGVVLDIREEAGTRFVEVAINDWKKKPDVRRHPQFAHVPAADDSDLEGTGVVLLGSSLGGISARKSKRVREASGPGAWLTHGQGSPPARRARSKKDLLAELDALRIG